MPQAIHERVRRIVAEVAGKPVPKDPEESLFESGLLDSFALPDLVGALEYEFAVKVADSELNPRLFDSIARIADFLARRT